MSIIQNVLLHSKPGKAEEVWKHLGALSQEAERNEPGTLAFIPAKSSDDENTFFIWEEYTDEQAIIDHRQGKTFQAFGRLGLVADLKIARGSR